MSKGNKTATKVIFIIATAVFVIGVLELLLFLFDASVTAITVSFFLGFFISYFGAILEEKLYANSK